MGTTVTKRVVGTAAGGARSRVPFSNLESSLLLLEGDESGYLYLEGDAVTDLHDKLLLQGDEVDTSFITKRIAQLP